MGLVIKVRRGVECSGVMPFIVVLGSMVLNIMFVEADETICWVVGVLRISEVGAIEDVDSSGSGVALEVSGIDGVGNMMVVCTDVLK